MPVFERYESYKDSGVEWLGEVPAHWKVKRLKDVTQIKTGAKDTIDNVNEGQYPFFVRSQTVEKINSYSFDGEAILTAGDGVGVGKVFHHTNEKFDYHQRVYKVSHFRNIFGRFVFYYMKENFYKDALRLNVKSTVDSLRMPMFSNFPIPFSNMGEQKAIANYLDTKTAQIDRKIELLCQKAEKYGKLKQSLINETVTRGLDKSVPMKDSGIEWVGDVPAHWEVKRLKDVTHIKTGSKDTIDNVDEGKYPFFVRSQTIEKINSYSFDGEAILTAGDGVGVGKVFHHINGKFDYHQRVYKISHFRKVVGRFVFYYMKENFYKDALRLNAKSTVDSLRMPMFNNFPISIGDVDEQQAIANYLDTKTSIIDRIIETVNSQINNLKELRKTLINDVVTGKIKVVDHG